MALLRTAFPKRNELELFVLVFLQAYFINHIKLQRRHHCFTSYIKMYSLIGFRFHRWKIRVARPRFYQENIWILKITFSYEEMCAGCVGLLKCRRRVSPAHPKIILAHTQNTARRVNILFQHYNCTNLLIYSIVCFSNCNVS